MKSQDPPKSYVRRKQRGEDAFPAAWLLSTRPRCFASDREIPRGRGYPPPPGLCASEGWAGHSYTEFLNSFAKVFLIVC